LSDVAVIRMVPCLLSGLNYLRKPAANQANP